VHPRRAVLAAAAAAAALAAGGCGGDDDGGEATTTTTTAAAAPRVTVLTAALTGNAARPRGPAAGHGTATLRIDLRRSRACWTLSVSGVDRPISAHVHAGAAGEIGDVVIPLGDRYARRGCVLSVRKALREVLAAPGAYYVNVHTNKHLTGAVRGQLGAAGG
jgi:hypothetical protein